MTVVLTNVIQFFFLLLGLGKVQSIANGGGGD